MVERSRSSPGHAIGNDGGVRNVRIKNGVALAPSEKHRGR